MTREEAIKRLETCDDCGDCLTCKAHDEAIEVVLSALKEQDVTDTNVGSKWISVKERLPEIISIMKAGNNTYKRSIRVLCACKQADGKRMVKEGYFEFFNDYPDPHWRIPGTIHSVTHWMLLPEPPKEDAE